MSDIMDERIVLSNQFTIDAMKKFNITQFDGFEKDSDFFKYVKMYNDMFKNLIRNWYEMALDHPLFVLYNITSEGLTEDDYCESKEIFADRITKCIMQVNQLINQG